MIIKLTGNHSILKHHFQHNFLNENFHVTLLSFYSTNLIPNVTDKNNIFYFGANQILIPKGYYDIFDIETFIKNNCQITLRVNEIKNQVYFENNSDKPINYERKNNICKLLGYPNSYPNFLPVDTINVHCNLANGQSVIDGETDIITTFKMNAHFREPIIYESLKPIYFPVQHNKIKDIEVKITNERNELIDFGGAKITIILEIKNF